MPFVRHIKQRNAQQKCTCETKERIDCVFPGTTLSSMVMCADLSGLTFTLALIRTEPTYNQPMQQWSFVSDFAVSCHLDHCLS